MARRADVVTAYARRVVDDEIVAGKWVRLACERHLRDLVKGRDRGLWFNAAMAERAITFFRFLRHSKGEWAGRPFILEAWNEFIVGSLFGWLGPDGFRRFRVGYEEVARKNGKSTRSAGIGLYLFVADGEPGAEVYTAATKRDQARIVHGEAIRMVKNSPDLKRRVRIFKDNLHIEATASKYEPLGADADTMDGLNPHGVIIDELHAHKTRHVWDVLDTATAARRQALIFGITTAGVDQRSICYEQHEHAEQVLAGVRQDDSYFAFIASLDEGDDWRDDAVWIKANPNLDISVKREDLRRKAKRAEDSPAALNAFLRLHGNIWTQQETKWLTLEVWDRCGGLIVPEQLAGRRCYGGLDLSATTDLTAFVLVFEPEGDEPAPVLPFFWLPEACLSGSSGRPMHVDQYRAWHRQGFLRTTPGEVVNYGFIEQAILEMGRQYHILEIAHDRWGALDLSQRLAGHGFTMVATGQGFASMSAPTQELQALCLASRLNHGGHPVLRWNADCMVVKQDPAGNVKPVKPERGTSRARIDGMVALIMALDRMIRQQALPTREWALV